MSGFQDEADFFVRNDGISAPGWQGVLRLECSLGLLPPRGRILAGRTAGFFSMGADKATVRLRKALRETEIQQVDDDPLFADQKPGAQPTVTEWAQRLVGAHQEMQHARS